MHRSCIGSNYTKPQPRKGDSGHELLLLTEGILIVAGKRKPFSSSFLGRFTISQDKFQPNTNWTM